MTNIYTYAHKAKELGINIRELCDNAAIDENADFEVDNYRFIKENSIDKIQQDELSSDEYTLGCFNAWFLADVLNIDIDVIEAMQKSEAYDVIGELVLSMGKLDELQKAYASADGYGHYFSSYDFSEDQVGDYYLFRTA